MRQLIDAVRRNLGNLLRFSGRERRGSFWRYVLALYVAQMALSTLLVVSMMAARSAGGAERSRTCSARLCFYPRLPR